VAEPAAPVLATRALPGPIALAGVSGVAAPIGGFPIAMQAHVKNGFPVALRFSVCADPEAPASSPIARMVDQLARRNQLVTWARPPIPEFNLIARTLEKQVHAAVFLGKSPGRRCVMRKI